MDTCAPHSAIAAAVDVDWVTRWQRLEGIEGVVDVAENLKVG